MEIQGDLKAILFSLTGVPPDRMKLVGLIKGKLPGDEEEVIKLGLQGSTNPQQQGDSKVVKKKEFMMIGTPQGEEHKQQLIGPINTGDEADIDYTATTNEAFRKAQLTMESVRNKRKLKETSENLKIDQMMEPRKGKKLLGEH